MCIVLINFLLTSIYTLNLQDASKIVEPKLPDEDVEESEVQEVGQAQEQTPEEDEIVPIDVKKGNLER